MAAIAVSRAEVTPFASAMRSALCKVLAPAPAVRTAEAAQLMDRVPLIGPARPGNNGSQPRVRLDTGGGLAAVELAIRTAMTRLGASLLERLLALRLVGRARDRARGGVRLLPRREHSHRAGPGQHRPGLASRRTVLARLALADGDLGVAGASMSPGLRNLPAQGRRGGAVRQSGRPARRAGRPPLHGQAHRAVR